MVTFIRLKRDLFERLEFVFPEELNFICEYDLWRDGRVDTAGLDRNDTVTAILQEVLGVEADNTCLVGLGNVGKDDIHSGDKHAVFLWCTGILNNGYMV